MKRPFIAIHDYQHGGVAVRVFAEHLAEVASALRQPKWRVYDEVDPACPEIGVEIVESDIEDQAEWLRKQIYIQDRQAEGKRSFPVRGHKEGRPEYRNLWARSKEEVQLRFRDLEFLYGVPLGERELSAMCESDIDAPDDFIKQYERDA